MSSDPALLDPGLWRQRAAQLVGALRSDPQPDVRLAILRKFIKGLGDEAFPNFIKLLLVVADSEDNAAKTLLAETYVHALVRMDVPGGLLSAWGVGASMPGQRLSAASLAASSLGSAPRRSFGPIEYLTVWFGQKTQRPYLTAPTYREALAKLIALYSVIPELPSLYSAKILTDLASAPEGSYTRQTRARLDLLANSWRQGDKPEAIALAVGGEADSQDALLPKGWLLKDL